MFQSVVNYCCFIVLLVAVFVCPAPAGIADDTQAASKKDEKNDVKKTEKQQDPYAWRSLFDGKTLEGWKPAEFGGAGEVKVRDGQLILGCGESLTGIVYKGEAPSGDFELTMEAMRLDGSDFFATTTFPIGKSYCSLVVGGWGGTVVGISSVDYYDAGDNITTRFVDLRSKRWYRVRLCVRQSRIEAWIGDEKVVDLATKGHKFDTRFEVDACKPFGIASYCTTAALRDIRIRQLKPEKISTSPEKKGGNDI